MPNESPLLSCPSCGQVHASPILRPGQRASCVRCGTLIAEAGHLGARASFVFACTGLVLALPSLVLPFVTLSKFGNSRTVLLTDSFDGFWKEGFAPIGAAVLVAGTLAPFTLLGLLVAFHLTADRKADDPLRARLAAWAHNVEFWAMPEVQILGVLVAFFKLGSVVDVVIGPAMYSYGACSVFTLLAWRSFKLRPRARRVPRVTAGASA